MVTLCQAIIPNLAENSEAQFARLVADAFREQGWNRVRGALSEDGRPDLVVSAHGKKLIIESSGHRKAAEIG
jgi:Holliday junction resolvase